MVRVGRDLWTSSSPAPLLKQVHLEQAAQNLVQVGLEYLQKTPQTLFWAACSSAPSLDLFISQQEALLFICCKVYPLLSKK